MYKYGNGCLSRLVRSLFYSILTMAFFATCVAVSLGLAMLMEHYFGSYAPLVFSAASLLVLSFVFWWSVSTG